MDKHNNTDSVCITISLRGVEFAIFEKFHFFYIVMTEDTTTPVSTIIKRVLISYIEKVLLSDSEAKSISLRSHKERVSRLVADLDINKTEGSFTFSISLRKDEEYIFNEYRAKHIVDTYELHLKAASLTRRIVFKYIEEMMSIKYLSEKATKDRKERILKYLKG